MSIYFYVITGIGSVIIFSIGTLLLYLKYRKNIYLRRYQVKHSELQHKKELLKAIINSQEQERERIGMDLHDDVGSELAHLRLRMETFVDQEPDRLQLKEFVGQCKQHIDDIIRSVRNISHNLSPILNDTADFLPAINDFCEAVNGSGKINIRVTTQAIPDVMHFETFTKLCLFRVITELVTNTIRHASAKQVLLDFSEKDGNCLITYTDDGIGFSHDSRLIKKGIGLKNIESRLESIHATFLIKSTSGNGFTMVISVPVMNE